MSIENSLERSEILDDNENRYTYLIVLIITFFVITVYLLCIAFLVIFIKYMSY